MFLGNNEQGKNIFLIILQVAGDNIMSKEQKSNKENKKKPLLTQKEKKEKKKLKK